ncbi:rho guanine nucleotide exchange factor 10-like isoform X3 [Rhodnius prolixus]|uniref:rho guanine nucleotide exchange factor 10-like isoform X3 n=1 Tax=Rhodnius prolixus TaxID=13249 RepID=UPI003D18B3D2
MENEGCLVGGTTRRQAFLRFPSPPPFPPDEYSYAYYEGKVAGGVPGGGGGGGGCNSTLGRTVMIGGSGAAGGSGSGASTGGSAVAGAGSSGSPQPGPSGRPGGASPVPGPSGMCKGSSRHTYMTRYGTQENLYEEIQSQMRLEDEVRYVHSKHLQVLGELNLSMEAMLMPPPVPGQQSELTTEALMSPAACSVDSGFSSSSTGTNSLGRPHSSAKKKTPHSFWKKLPGLGATSSSSTTLVRTGSDEQRSTSASWDESSHEQSRRSSCSDVDLSSGDEGNKCIDGKGRMGSKRSVWRKTSPEPGGGGGGGDSPQGRILRWFSMKKQTSMEQQEPRGKMPLLREEEECIMTQRHMMALTLPPPPPNLTSQELKLRHIIEAIVQSENSYLSTLHRLIYDYKKPLEEANPPILTSKKIQTLFHRLPEIRQCHGLFRIVLAQAVANWDQEHRIGDVFVASFSKAVVLDIYSDFINNFSVAMDLARSESKKKPALAEFLKARQATSPDRLSFFGLMVKPVQRFPQFILFLQDLLQNTGHGHPERMALQLALTQLESLAELLNERKRESEQTQAFRQVMRSISSKMASAATAAGCPPEDKYLIRHDDVTQLEVNSCGLISKCKNRRLLLLNDQLICVALNSKEENVNSQPRLTYKWSCPITDVQVIENSGSPTLSRLLTPNGSLASTNSSGTTDSLCMEMSQLMHDYQVISRIHNLTHTLKGQYQYCQEQEVNGDVTRGLLDNIQREIQRKDEQMAWLDSCCLQLAIRGKEESFTFQMNSQEARKEWITELRLARLALDPSNSPAWEVPEQELRPSNKMPLFVAAHPVYTPDPNAEVTCGCYYSTTCGKTAYLWVCTFDGVDSQLSIAQTWQTSLKPLTQVLVVGFRVTAIEYIRGTDTVWLGTTNNRLLVYSVCDVERPELVHSLAVTGEVVNIKMHCDNVFVSLTTGRLLMYRRHCSLTEPEELVLGPEPVSAVLPINLSLFAATGKTVTVLSAITGELQKSFTIQNDVSGGHISYMAHSGVGLWLSLANSCTISLYHTETFTHLQDINVAGNVVRVTGIHKTVTVTSLMAVKGLLWVGTDAGVALTVPLPRLEGVPIISGRVNVSLHGHTGPLTLMVPLTDPPPTLKRPASRALASDVYGLYGQLMYVKDYEDDRSDSDWSCPSSTSEPSGPPTSSGDPRYHHTLVTITAGNSYVNYQHSSYNNASSLPHVIIWEMKL